MRERRLYPPTYLAAYLNRSQGRFRDLCRAAGVKLVRRGHHYRRLTRSEVVAIIITSRARLAAKGWTADMALALPPERKRRVSVRAK